MRHFNWMNFKIKIKTVTKSLVSKKMLTRLFVVAAIFCGCNSYIFSLDFIRTDIDIDLESNSVDNFIDKFEDVIVPDNDVNEDANLTTLQLIRKYGYPSEKHHVITDDGYILELHRIPREGAVPVLLVHGLLDASSTWVMMGPNKGFAYMLSDEKYDVWMANVRGNTYSKNHTTYDTNKAEFWDFSFHEMGVYDIPAIIDYVLEKTRYSQLHYIGHSQGTTCFWIMCSLRPQYNDKIISMQALAPAAFIKGCKSPVIKFLAFFRRSLNVLLRIIGTHDFLPSNSFIRRFSEYICKDESIVQQFCSQIMFIIAGYDKQQMNHTMLPVIFGHTPAGASTKQLLHFGQLKSSGHFRQYDHGILKNYKIYGKFSPPDYNLQYVKTKVCLHYGANDWLTIPHDVEQLHQALPNVVGKFLVKFPLFNHLDFVWGIDARDLVYEKVLRLMKLIEDGYL